MAKGREGRLLLVKLFLFILFSLFIIIIIIIIIIGIIIIIIIIIIISLLLCAPFILVTAGFTFDFCALKPALSQCFGYCFKLQKHVK